MTRKLKTNTVQLQPLPLPALESPALKMEQPCTLGYGGTQFFSRARYGLMAGQPVQVRIGADS
jgi:hypothetical protein